MSATPTTTTNTAVSDAVEKTTDAATSAEEKTTDAATSASSIFDSETSKIIVWVLIGFFGLLVILAVLFKDRLASMQAFTGKIVDVSVLGIIVYYAYYLYDKNKDSNGDAVEIIKKELGRELDDFNTVIYVGIFLIVIQAVSYGFSILTLAGDAPMSLGLLSGAGWIYMIILLIANFFKHVLKINISDSFPKKDEKKTDCKTDADGGEVFNISNNVYSYEEARQMCSSFGARLANYDEVEKAYTSGGEWCNYGWSEGQMILYPTQKDTWSVLQRYKKRANDCGRPGINGGYIVNPNVRFGANCYGKKPTASELDIQRMNAAKTLDSIPTSDDEKALDEKVRQWKNINVSPFNKNKWSAY